METWKQTRMSWLLDKQQLSSPSSHPALRYCSLIFMFVLIIYNLKEDRGHLFPCSTKHVVPLRANLQLHPLNKEQAIKVYMETTPGVHAVTVYSRTQPGRDVTHGEAGAGLRVPSAAGNFGTW